MTKPEHKQPLRYCYLNIAGRVILTLLFLLGYSKTQAQDIRVSIRLTKLAWRGIGDGDGSAEPRFKFKHKERDTDLNFGSCFQYSGRGSGVQYPNAILRTIDLPINNPFFTLEMEAFEKDRTRSNECNFNGRGLDRDDYQEFGERHINAAAMYLQPGVFSAEREIETGHFTATFVYRYWIIGSPNLISPAPTGIVCSGDPFTLQTSVNSIRTDGLRYVWEYNIVGDEYETWNPDYQQCADNCSSINRDPFNPTDPSFCFDYCASLYPPTITVKNWRPLQTSDANSVIFTPNSLINGGIKTNTAISFRVKAISTTGLTTELRVSNPYDFAPPSPSINPTNITPVASCPNKPTGSLQLRGVTSLTGEYRVILTPSGTQPADVNACIGSNQCPTLYKSYLVTSRDTVLNDLPPGNHRLWLTNPGGSIGICYNTYEVTISSHPVLALTATKKDISCQGAGDGEITFSHTGGFGSVLYTITNTQGTQWTARSDSTLRNLPPGSYTVKVTDSGCGQDNANTTAQVTIQEPTRVTATIQTEGSRCISPGGGKLTVAATQGSGSYNYRLLNTATNAVVAQQNAHANSWQFNTLAAGNYQLEVRDAARPACEGYQTTFSISQPEAFAISSVTAVNIDCNSAATGSIRVGATGGIPEFRAFVITRGGQEQINTTGVFENLPAGTYQVWVRSTVPDCSDQLSYPDPVVITQPSPIAVTLSKTDIVCNGDNNGTVTARISGGVPGYTLTWEQGINGTWNTVTTASTQAEAQLTGRSGGTYRLKITDAKGCSMVSSDIVVAEPAPLRFATVQLVRPGCVSTQVNVETTISGGTPPYITQYAPAGNSNFTNFDRSTLIGLGSYKIRVTDARNCRFEYPETITVTENAINIQVTALPVCYKQTNGKIKLRVSGGFAPYQYSITNGQTFTTSPDFDNVAAGAYTILVKDARGCTNTTTTTVSRRSDQPEINFSVATRQNALDTLVLSEISLPKPDSLRWQFDSRAIVIDPTPREPKIRFNQEGAYIITMTGWFGGCEYSITKTLALQPYDPTAPPASQLSNRPISQFKVSPNPTSGQFTAEVTLLRKQPLVIVLYDMLGNEKYRRQWNEVKQITEPITLENPVNGMYLIRAITGNDAREIKLVVNP